MFGAHRVDAEHLSAFADLGRGHLKIGRNLLIVQCPADADRQIATGYGALHRGRLAEIQRLFAE